MKNDNTTPMSAGVYDQEINNTIPYYSEFYDQTLDVIEQCNYYNGGYRWKKEERTSNDKPKRIGWESNTIDNAIEQIIGAIVC